MWIFILDFRESKNLFVGTITKNIYKITLLSSDIMCVVKIDWFVQMKISQKHPNRQPHNWLIYDVNDQWLEKYIHMYEGTIYDLGCGESPYREWFLNYASSYLGVDWSDSFHNLSADIQADLNQMLPIESEVADTVVSFSVIGWSVCPAVLL